LVGVAAGLLGIGAASFFVYRRSRAVRPKPAPVPQVAVLLPSEVTLIGRVEAFKVATKVVNVPVPVDGILEQFLADTGEDVSEGEVLARIKNPKSAIAQEAAMAAVEGARNRVTELEAAAINARLEASRSEAEATRTKLELARAEKEYARQQMMMREGVTPRLVFEKAEQEYNALKKQSEDNADAAKRAADRAPALSKELESAQKALEQKINHLDDAQAAAGGGEVYSSADGVVIARRGQPGKPVTRAITDLFQVAVEVTALQVVVSPDPQIASRIHSGQTVRIEMNEIPSMVQGTVREIKAGLVVIDFGMPLYGLRPGMTARVTIGLT